MRRAYLVFLKLVIVLGLAVIAFEAAAAVYPPLGGAIIWLKSASGSQCNLVETINSVAFELKQQKALERIQPAAHIVKREDGMNLWDIPGARQFWVAANVDSERVLE